MVRNNALSTLVVVVIFISIISICIVSISIDAATAYPGVQRSVDEKLMASDTVDVIIMIDSPVSTIDNSVSADASINTNAVATQSSKSRQSSVVKLGTQSLDTQALLDSVPGFKKKDSLTIINGYSGTLTREGLEELRRNNASIRVYENIMLSVNDRVNISDTLRVMSDPTLSNCAATINANYSWNVLNITGNNVTVVVIDTGIDYNNPAIASDGQRCFGDGTNYSCKVFGGYDFFNGDPDPMDDNLQGGSQGHGTDVASILSASGDSTGVAPNVRLYALKVCDSSGTDCPLSDVLLALNWTRDNFEHIDVASMSMGDFFNKYPDTNDMGNTGRDPLSTAVDALVNNGTTMVVSAGNGGPGVSTVTFPAVARDAISVGAVNDNGTSYPSDDVVWSVGGRGPGAFGRLKPDITAPCAIIQSMAGYLVFQAGTSMSAPFVSGAAALLYEKHPELTPLEVRAILLQSARNISGKVFEKGAGVVDMMNALDGEVYALIYNTNTLGQNATNDRWEFIVTPYKTSYANLTIINNNDYDITLNPIIDTIANMENDVIIDPSQVHVPSGIVISANSNASMMINFSLDNFSAVYPTTYGGMIILNGSGNNGTADVTKTIGVPILITIPIMNNGYVNGTLNNIGDPWYSYLNYDIYHYCYYNPKTKNVVLTVNWTQASTDIDMYLYGSTQDFIKRSASDNILFSTYNETMTITEGDVFKWIRVDGYMFDSPVTFTLNITETGNHPPNITDVQAVGGINNASDTLIFYRPKNITINVSYADVDNDSIIIAINDSNYISISNYSSADGSTGYALYVRPYDIDFENNSAISITASDPYDAIYTVNANIFLHDSMMVNGYTPAPSSNTIYARKNTSVQFTTDISDVTNKTLYYYWYVNDTINASGDESRENYTFDTTNHAGTLYSITVVAYNNATINDTNETIVWSVYIDGMAPNITIQDPGAMTLNQSKIYINYSVNDASSGAGSGISGCWYYINGTSIIDSINNITANYTTDGNVSLSSSSSSCSNTSIYMVNGLYALTIYANDSVGNTGYSSVTFDVFDTTAPNILGLSPQGIQAYIASVNLSVVTDENATCRFSNQSADVDYDSMVENFSDNITQHALTNYSVTEGSHTLYVRCRDMSNNTDNSSSIIGFSITSSSPPDTGGTGGSGGGGGGGGSGGSGGSGGLGGGLGSGSGGTGGNNLSTSENFDTLNQGENNMTVTNVNIPVSQVSLNTNVSLFNVTITLNKTNTPRANYTGGLVYAYLYLDQMNLPAEALLSAKIYFNVDYKWLKENNVSKDDMNLLMFDNVRNNWDPLATVFLKEDNETVYYAAESSGLGLYVISNNRTMREDSTPKAKEPENNKTFEKNGTLSVNSKSGASSGNFLYNGANNFINSLKKSDDLTRIIFILVCTFLFVIAIMLLIRHTANKHYKNELILATDKNLDNVSDELAKKVPNIPDNLEKIRLDVARKFSEGLSNSSKPMTKEDNPFMNQIFVNAKKQNEIEALRNVVKKSELKRVSKIEELKKEIKTDVSKKEIKDK